MEPMQTTSAHTHICVYQVCLFSRFAIANKTQQQPSTNGDTLPCYLRSLNMNATAEHKKKYNQHQNVHTHNTDRMCKTKINEQQQKQKKKRKKGIECETTK